MSSSQVQSLPVQTLTPPPLPTIRVQSASPDYIAPPGPIKNSLNNFKAKTLPRSRSSPPIKRGRIQRREGLRQQINKASSLPSHMVKEVKQTKKTEETEEKAKKNEADMSPRSAGLSPASSKASSPGASTSSKKPKPTAKDADWADVTDPEERRRIQNRIAQRKFREKARENKEKAEREVRNQENAGNSYRIPTVEDFMNDTELTGLPWGSVNLGHVVSRGLEMESRRSSGRGTGDDGYQNRIFGVPNGHGLPQTASYGSSGPEDVYMDDPSYGYSPVFQGFTPITPQ